MPFGLTARDILEGLLWIAVLFWKTKNRETEGLVKSLDKLSDQFTTLSNALTALQSEFHTYRDLTTGTHGQRIR